MQDVLSLPLRGAAPLGAGRAATFALAGLWLAVLAVQNIWMLGPLYRGEAMVPFDFVATYHAVPFFWIEAMRAGVSPAWVPFQALGYPLYLHSQSGFLYPGFWWFVLAGQAYTFDAAQVFQGLHLLLGAIGAGVCARLSGTRWSTALIAAVAYQAFGPFFSNASHPDIVRAHALAPWVLAPVLAHWTRRLALDLSILALPLWLYGLWTGGYPGAAIAVCMTAGTVLLVRIATERGQARRVGLWIMAAMAVGMLLAGLFLAPNFLDRGLVERAAIGNRFPTEYMEGRDFLGFFLRVDDHTWFRHDVTMRSVSLGVLALFLALGRICFGRLRWAMPALVLVFVAGLMATGLAHRPLSVLIPPLGYSRFPLSDYRGLLGLGLVLLAAQAWECLGHTSGRQKALAWLLAAVLSVLVAGIAWFAVYPTEAWTSVSMRQLLQAFGLALAFYGVTMVVATRARALWPMQVVLLVGALLLVGTDWSRVHGRAGYLFGPSPDAVAQRQLGTALESATASLRQTLLQPPPCRPARQLVPESEFLQTPWRGYYTGAYMSHDYSGPLKFVRHQEILGNLQRLAFAMQPWTAVMLPADASAPAALDALPRAGIRCVRYGTDEVRYEVHLDQPATIVENEVYWTGWTMQVDGREIQAQPVDGFRAWALPAGNYQVVAKFSPPHRATAWAVFLVGLAAWLLLAFFIWKTRPRS